MRPRSSVTTNVSKVFTRIEARGLGEVLSLGAGRVSGWFSSSDVLIFFVAPASADASSDGSTVFRTATEADGSAYARDIGTDSASSFATRLTGENICFLVEEGGVILHASWATTGAAWTRELDRYVTAPGHSAYTYESFTRGDARGRGLYPAALGHIRAWAAQQHLHEVWVAVEADNPPSLRAVAKAGFEEAFKVAFSRRFGRVSLGIPEGPRADAARGLLSLTA